MSSKRKAIRHAIVRMLALNTADEYPTTCADRVFPSRPTPLWESELPAICVYPVSETCEPVVEGACDEYRRSLTMSIEIIAQADEELDDVLDDISEQVEQVIGDNKTLLDEDDDEIVAAEIMQLDPRGVEVALVDDGEQIIGSCKISVLIRYVTTLGGPPLEADFDTFESADVTYEPGSGANAQDIFDVRESE